MSILDHVFSPVQFDSYLNEIEAIDLTPVSAAPTAQDDAPAIGVPLDEWLISQAAWWRHRAQETDSDACLLASNVITRIAQSVRFHRCTTVAELLERSPLYRHVNLTTIETPGREERRFSALAVELDQIVEDLLIETGTAARLVAWAVLDLSYDADFFHADTAEQFNESKAAFEAACEADSLEIAF